MKFKLKTSLLALMASCLLVPMATSHADDATGLKPIPKTRVEIKKNLDALKSRKRRLAQPESTGERPQTVNNARARAYFLPAEWFAGEPRLGGSPQTNNTELVDYELKTKCFWIVSRGNNCHYCLGHQEHKLHVVGLSDDDLAALDHDWSHFDARTQKALTLARKMTQSPQEMTDADIAQLHPEFDDAQIIELVYTIARFNSTNRWTDSMGIPQDQEMRGEAIHFDSPTAEKWSNMPSLASPNPSAKRELISDSQAEGEIAKAESRKPRVKLPSDDETRKVLELKITDQINDWQRAIAALKAASPKMVSNHFVMIRHAELAPQLKLAIMRRTAMWNHSWLSLAIAEHELKQTEPNSSVSKEAQTVALDFADKLTAKPFAISDADIQGLQKHFSDRQVAQIIHVVATANGLDRFCETLGLSSALAED